MSYVVAGIIAFLIGLSTIAIDELRWELKRRKRNKEYLKQAAWVDKLIREDRESLY